MSLAVTSSAMAQEANIDSLIAAAREARTFLPKDQFSAPPPGPNVKDQALVLLMKVSPNGPSVGNCYGSPWWKYDVSSGTLSIYLPPEAVITRNFRQSETRPPFSDISGVFLEAVALECSSRRLPNQVMENAFGATVSVARTAVTFIGIAQPNATLQSLELHVPMAGERVRALVGNLRVRLRGQMEEWRPGQSLRCGITEKDASMESSWAVKTSACLYRASFTSFEVIDQSNGSVVGELVDPILERERRAKAERLEWIRKRREEREKE
ncbi:hypothetical protein [Sphingomonas colocasiae]|uniref:Uncharacterized protein n=1 Tax=Sphingomonas colocasiae TaxID=1848973 RepID=A0ABS7PJ99_9SPHN|nr:hypothetical protein [Sphingomonas colocasiae]MBY8821044.1 hypothetical protein [Sphingomonas colocasiae]